jgi:hypothetical protein
MSVELEVAGPGESEQDAELEYFESYRALSSMAVTSFVLGLISIVHLWSAEFGLGLGIVPVLGLALGLRAMWVIRTNPREYTGLLFAKVGAAVSALFLIAGWSLAGFVYATEVPEGYERISYNQLQAQDRIQSNVVPKSALELHGKRVFIKGYVYPGQAQTRGIKQFVLCRDNGDCCFGGTPPLTDKILITLQDPLRLNYSTRLQKLAGTFYVAPTAGIDAPGDILYQLEADYLK